MAGELVGGKLMAGNADERFEYGLRLLIRGLVTGWAAAMGCRA